MAPHARIGMVCAVDERLEHPPVPAEIPGHAPVGSIAAAEQIPAKRFGYLLAKVKERYKDDSLDISSAGEKVRKLIDERATGFPLVPTMAAILLQMDLAKYDWSRLRYVTTAAAAMPTEHILQLQRALPHARIYSMYGQTECTRVT